MSHKNALVCPKCGGDLNGVMDSRPHEIGLMTAIKRRRMCDGCGKRHTTYELVEEDILSLSLNLRRTKEAEAKRLRAQLDRVTSAIEELE